MKTRVISALVGLVLLTAVLVFHETLLFDVAIAFLSGAAVYELIRAAGLHKYKNLAVVCIAFAVLFSSEYYQGFASFSGFVEFAFGIVMFVFLLRNHNEVRVTEVAFAYFVTVFVPKAFSVAILFRGYGSEVFFFLMLSSFGVAWFNDICAFFTGRFLGRRKLCPEISPKKTVEGAIGGVLGDVILCAVFAFVFGAITDLSINWFSYVLFVPVGAFIAILGDLAASVIKRQFAIKDYSNIMPGHGGVVDRFDSWIFVVPVLYVWNINFPFIG